MDKSRVRELGRKVAASLKGSAATHARDDKAQAETATRTAPIAAESKVGIATDHQAAKRVLRTWRAS